MAKTFDKDNLKEIRASLEAAFKLVADKHEITLGIGSISFKANSFTARLTATIDDGTAATTPGVDPKWIADFRATYRRYGLVADDLGRKFTLNGREVTLVGSRSKANNPLVVLKADGKFLAIPAEAAAALKKL